MKKRITTILLLAFSALWATAQENTYEIKVGEVTMTVDAGRGAKILSYKYADQEVLSQSRFPNSFGSTFWTSPQVEWNWPPVPEHDSRPYTVEEKDGALVMTSGLSEKIPLRIVKKFTTDPDDNAIVIEYSIINESGADRSVAPWEITRVPADGIVFFDAPVEKIWPADLMSFKDESGIAWFKFDQANENRKVNADGKGWLAFAGNGLLMVKRFQDITPEQPAPQEAEIQVYVNRGKTYVELESQGAYTALKPGESLTWTVRWYLAPQETPVDETGEVNVGKLREAIAKVK